MKKIVVFSNKFSPAHVQHLKAFYNSFIELGLYCTLVLDENYNGWFDENYNIVYNTEWSKNNHQYDIVWIYNLSKIDSKMIKNIENYKSIKKYIVVHEPWAGIKNTVVNLFSRKEDIKEIIRSIGRKVYLSKLLKNKFDVVLCSNNAKKTFESHFKRIKTYLFSLIFIDELNGKSIEQNDKKYFSFIGTATLSHGFDKYLDYIKKHPDLLCQIVTSTNIEKYYDAEILQMIQDNKLFVKQGKYLSNEEMNEAYYKAQVLWLNYKRSTQSGCLCKAFMFGTPVICSNNGSFDEYVNDSNGIFVEDEENICYSHLIGKKVSENCRNSYMEYFDYKGKLEKLKKIIGIGD